MRATLALEPHFSLGEGDTLGTFEYRVLDLANQPERLGEAVLQPFLQAFATSLRVKATLMQQVLALRPGSTTNEEIIHGALALGKAARALALGIAQGNVLRISEIPKGSDS